MISRRFDCDFRNFGWSGNAKGEKSLADYIATQEMSLFFLDYDHNAPSPEFIEETHEKFFLTVREKNPDLPIIITTMTDPARYPNQKDYHDIRCAAVRKTYENAVRRGDRNVYFINGGDVFSAIECLGVSADSCTVDGCHPNDLGFAAMAKVFGEKIEQVLCW